MTTSTNATTSTTPTTMVPTMTTPTTVQTVNDSALASILASNLFHKLGDTQQALIVACSLVDALDQEEYFFEMFCHTVQTAQLTTSLKNVMTATEVVIDMEALGVSLVQMGYMTDEGKVGDNLRKATEISSEAYAPTQQEVVRRFPTHKLEVGQKSNLLVEAIEALEDTWFTVDSHMVELWNQFEARTGGSEENPEAYVLAGCNVMSSEAYYHSEFMADRRGRLYQAACHGPNGQASDKARAMMNLAGVPLDYDKKVAWDLIMEEMADMVAGGQLGIKAAMTELNMIGELEFLVKHDEGCDGVKKAWSFVKAARIMGALKRGETPYIGMAVGLDAKCSGPQLGALMVGDGEMAAACGMTMELCEDAYERAVKSLAQAGFHGFTRNGIKKSFMGVFYGQGYAAFTNVTSMMQEEDMKEVVAILAPEGIVPDEVAKKFHKAITKSFGKKMCALRERLKEFGGLIQGRTHHMMPDGFKVQMNYKQKWNINNELMEFGVEAPDAIVVTEGMTRKFIKLQLNTLDVHTGDFVRNGFVNMIQATDALIARLIIVHLKRMGAKHIISVHDCFRVNITEMPLLKQAIINAYQDLFGTVVNCKTKDLPLGQDILGLYFEGVSKSVVDGAKVVPMPQFLPFGPKPRKMAKVGEHKLGDVIDALGTSYYFAK